MGSIYVLRSHLTIGICWARRDSSFVRRWIFIYCLYSSYFMLYSINCGVSSRDSLPCYQYWGLRSLIFSLIIVNTDGCLCLLLLKEKWRRHIFAFIYSGNFIRPSLVKISLIIENSNTYQVIEGEYLFYYLICWLHCVLSQTDEEQPPRRRQQKIQLYTYCWSGFH